MPGDVLDFPAQCRGFVYLRTNVHRRFPFPQCSLQRFAVLGEFPDHPKKVECPAIRRGQRIPVSAKLRFSQRLTWGDGRSGTNGITDSSWVATLPLLFFGPSSLAQTQNLKK